MVFVDCCSKNSGKNTLQVWWGTGDWNPAVECKDSVPVAHRMVRLGTVSPLESISARLQKALLVPSVDSQWRDAADDEGAWDTSFHCMDRRRLAWECLHSRLASEGLDLATSPLIAGENPCRCQSTART